MDGISGSVIVYRLAERSALSVIVVLLALVVTIGFWKSLQKIDFRLSSGPVGGGGTLVIATPILAMLALIGFAWVSFSNPISYAASEASPNGPTAGGTPAAAAGTKNVEFRGSVPDPTAPEQQVLRRQVLRNVRSLNCLATKAAPLGPTQEGAIAAAKLALMDQVWDPVWGDPEAFRLSLLRAQATDSDARAFFDALDLC